MTDYEYDIAISFCYEDEELALALEKALDGLKVFIYSKAQEDLAGTDGMQAFIDTFREKSRIVVIIHRDKWGTTKWTKVEENAIKDFCLNGNWHGLFLVRTPSSKKLPKWVPSTHLYFNLNEFQFDELVGAIKARAKEHGSDIRPESVADKGKRMAARHAYEKETLDLMRSYNGVEQATGAVTQMLEKISRDASSIAEEGIKIECEGGSTFFVIRANGVSLIMNWQHYVNSIENCSLKFRIFRGSITFPSERGSYWASREPSERQHFSLEIDRTEAFGWCMRERKGSKALNPKQAADFVLTQFLDAYEELKDEPFDDDW